MKTKCSNLNTRNSSIELLKIIGILLMMVSHIVQTLYTPSSLYPRQDYLLNLFAATEEPQYLLLVMLRSCGALGNTLFFVCSAWFWLEHDRVDKQKILQLILEIWVISIVMLVLDRALRPGNLPFSTLIAQFFPVSFENYWYMTCYLLFYPIHPYLNKIVRSMSQKTLLRSSLILFLLYFGINFLHYGHYYITSLVIWIAIYFMMAYLKYDLPRFSASKKKNLVLFWCGFLGNIGIIWLTNILGLRIPALGNNLLRWGTNRSPFILMMAFGLLNLFKSRAFLSPFINRLASLALLIYLIHENMLLREYYRPMIWDWIFTHLGYDYILVWLFAITAAVFLFSIAASIFYQYTLQKAVFRFVDWLYPRIRSKYLQLEDKILSMK